MLVEEDLEIDDVRWFLSTQLAERLLSFKEQPEELARFVWRGRLEDELYDMEERYVNDLEEDLDRKLVDEASVRGVLKQMRAAKKKRGAR